MAKYSLTQNGEIINFNEIDAFKNLKKDVLVDIIKFTGFFKTPEELRLYLLNCNLIKTNDMLKITYPSKKQITNLKYGITYREDLKFFSEENLKIFLKANKNNYVLLESLCNHFSDSISQKKMLEYVKRYMLVLREDRAALDDENEISKEFEEALDEIVARECHRYNSRTGKRNLNINFRGMRDFAMFISRFSKSNGVIIDNLKPNEFLEYVESLDETNINSSINKEKVKIKQKKKSDKKYNPNQMTLEDFGIS